VLRAAERSRQALPPLRGHDRLVASSRQLARCARRATLRPPDRGVVANGCLRCPLGPCLSRVRPQAPPATRLRPSPAERRRPRSWSLRDEAPRAPATSRATGLTSVARDPGGSAQPARRRRIPLPSRAASPAATPHGHSRALGSARRRPSVPLHAAQGLRRSLPRLGARRGGGRSSARGGRDRLARRRAAQRCIHRASTGPSTVVSPRSGSKR